jgi:hypothetical protein
MSNPASWSAEAQSARLQRSRVERIVGKVKSIILHAKCDAVFPF